MEHKRKAESLVNRLRTPLPSASITAMASRLDAISEALAYLVDKRWAKQKTKKVKTQIRKSAR